MNETADYTTRRGVLGALVVATMLAAVLAYANSFANGFVWDDVTFLLRQTNEPRPYAVAPLFFEDQHVHGRGQGNFYRPLVAASYLADFAFTGGPDPEAPMETGTAFFRLTNLLAHLAAALMLLAVLRRAAAPLLVQAIVPVLYVIHPLHTAAVAYISGRADPMAAAFMFAGLWCALQGGSTRRQWIGAAASLLCFTAALLSKESAMIYPVLLLLFLLIRPRAQGNVDEPRRPARWAAFGGALVVLAIYGALRATVLRFADPEAVAALPLGARLAETLKAFAVYGRLVVLPTGLHMERTLQGLGTGAVLAGAVLLAGLLAALAACAVKGQRRAALGLAWFLATWLPISGVFPLNAAIAEHWMYVPLAGLLWAAAEGAAALHRRSLLGRAAVMALVLAAGLSWMGLTAHRNREWESNERLFRATLAHNPDSARVHYNLAVTYGDLVGNPTGAKRHYAEVLRIHEEDRRQDQRVGEVTDQELEAHLSLGDLYAAENRIEAAARHYRVVMEMTAQEDPLHGMAAYAMGMHLTDMGQHEQARAFFERAAVSLPELRGQMDGMLGAAP